MVLLDTDVMIDVLRGYPPALAWLHSIDDDVVALPGFVLMELIQGCRTKKEQQSLTTELDAYKILWPNHSDCNDAVKLYQISFKSQHWHHRCFNRTVGPIIRPSPSHFQ